MLNQIIPCKKKKKSNNAQGQYFIEAEEMVQIQIIQAQHHFCFRRKFNHSDNFHRVIPRQWHQNVVTGQINYFPSINSLGYDTH